MNLILKTINPKLEAKKPCPLNICNGSGITYEERMNRDGTGYDEFVVKCPHVEDEEADEDNDRQDTP